MALRFAATLVVALSLVSPLTAAVSANAPEPPVERFARAWLTEDGLPQDSVNALEQTRDGFLWVGTGAGLARFDGAHFRKFGLRDGLRSIRITALAEDQAGALWIGTSGGGVSRWSDGRIVSFGPEEGFPAGLEVISLAADRAGSVWIGTSNGLVQWSGGSFKEMAETDGLPRGQVRALLVDSSDKLWVSVLTTGVFRRADGRFARVEGGDRKPTSIYCLHEDRDGAIWAGSDVLWRWDGTEWRRLDPSPGLPKAPIQCIAHSNDGKLWIGMRNHGLYRSIGDQFTLFASSGPLATQSVGAVLADREGSVWAGAVSGGLHRLSPRVLEYWGANAGLPPTATTSVAEDASGVLWVGTANRGIQRFENGRFTPLADPALEDSKIIYCVAAASDGAIWAGGEQCLYRIQSNEPVKAFDDPLVKKEAIRALCADGDALWIGTYASTLLKHDATGLHVVAPQGSFPGTISAITREATDVLWIGTSGGLHRWERGKVQTWTTRDGLLTANVRAVHRDPDGTLWIGTLGGGLARMKDGRIHNFTTSEGLVDDVISQILPDDSGALWLGCNRGLMRIERREVDAFLEGKITQLHPVVLGRNEGMLTEQCFGGTSPTAIKARDGRLFFPAMTGLAETNPRKMQELAQPSSQASIEEVFVDQRPQKLLKPLVIERGDHRRITIAYTAPRLRGGEWVSFRHRLEGFDENWVSAGSARLADYDSLPPGRYVFRVAVEDGKGESTPSGASLAFRVDPFLWETLWFRLGGAILLAAGSGAIAWWQLHRRHLRQLAELEQQRRQHAELAHGSRVALLGELSASLAHELKQPLTAILTNAQAALRFLNDDPADINEVRESLKDIASEDRRASEIINRMRAMMKKEEAQLEPRDINADIEQVLLLLRSELSTRQVSVDTRLSPDLPPVRGDHIQLQQVLLNLVINGCDAVFANPSGEKLLIVETARDGSEMIRVSVTDRGVGIAPGMLTRIFEPFYSTKETGLGMGLAVSQAIISSHGGRLWAENNSERGATFHFTLMLGERAR